MLLYLSPLPNDAATRLQAQLETRNGRQYLALEGDVIQRFEEVRTAYPDSVAIMSGERCGVAHHPGWIGQYIGSHLLCGDWFQKLEQIVEATEKA